MPRINTVKKAMKDQGSCNSCGKEIKKGDSYKWIKFRYGGRRVRCESCQFKSGDLTQSEFLSQVYTLNDRLSELTNEMSLEDIQSEVEDIISEFETLADECEEKRMNMPDSLQDSDVGCMLESRADSCREVTSNLEGIDFDFDESGARDEAIEELDDDEIHTKELTEEVKLRLREECKNDGGGDDEEIFKDLCESYVEEGLSEEDFEEKIEEKIDEKRQEKVDEVIDEVTTYSYEGE